MVLRKYIYFLQREFSDFTTVMVTVDKGPSSVKQFDYTRRKALYSVSRGANEAQIVRGCSNIT